MQHQDPKYGEFNERLKNLEASNASDLQQGLGCLIADIDDFAVKAKAERMRACRAIGFMAGMQYSESSVDNELAPLRTRIDSLLAKLTLSPHPDLKPTELDSQLNVFEASLSDPSPLPPVVAKIPSSALHKDGFSPIPKPQEAKSNNTIRNMAILGSVGFFGYMAFKNAPPEWLDYLADSIRPKQH